MSGLILPASVPGAVLEAVRSGAIRPVASWELERQIVDVLRRPRIRCYGVTEADLDDLLVVLGPLLPDVDVSAEVRDPDDAPVVAAAVAGSAEAIVTRDRDLLDETGLRTWLGFRGVEVLEPAEALRRLSTRSG